MTQSCSVELAAHGKRDFLVDVPQNQTRRFTVKQIVGAVHVVVPQPSAEDSALSLLHFANAAGRSSQISLLLGEGAGSHMLTLSNLTSQSVTVSVDVASPEPASPNSAQEQKAEKALAEAEMFRAQQGASRENALAAYDQAIHAWQGLGDAADQGRALTWKAAFLFLRQNDAQAAVPVIRSALALAPSMAPIEAANAWRVAGYIYAQLSDYEAARDAYTRASGGYRQAGDVFNQESLLDNLSRIERMEGNSAVALTDATEAENLATQIKDARGQLGIEEEIGSIHSTAGELEAAHDAYEKSLLILRTSPDATMEGFVWSDLGVVYTMLGDYGRAHDALDHAADVWSRNPSVSGEMNTLDDRGDLLLAEGKPDLARMSYLQGLERANKAGAPRFQIFFLRGIGDSYLYLKDPTNAEKNYQQALNLAIGAKEGDSIAYLECALGDAALESGQQERARGAFEKCWQQSSTQQAVAMKIRAQGGMARVALHADDLAEAETHGEEALSAIESVRNKLKAADLKTTYFASMHSYYDLQIQILARLNKEHPGEDIAWQAFLVAERDRSRSMLDQLAAAQDVEFAAAPSPLGAQYDAVVRRLRMLESKAARAYAHGLSAPSSIKEAIARLSAEEHALGAELALAPQGGSLHAAPLTLERIRNTLPEGGSALVEYWVGQDASYAWAITRSNIRMVRLPPEADLRRQVAAFRKAILDQVSLPPEVSAQQRAALQPLARRRTASLAASLAGTLFPADLLPNRVTNVVIVADGPLLAVPFAALKPALRRSGAEHSDQSLSFLSEPSAAVFSLLVSRPSQKRTMKVAVFGDVPPSAEAHRAETSGPSATSKQHEQATERPELPFAAQEAAMIRSVFGNASTEIFAGDSAEPGALRDFHWDAFNIGHFATHAVLDEQYAELNGLALGPGQGQMLWYGEVCRMNAKLDLVVLSACNTALGENTPGEGLQGLAQAFFVAGSQRVLGTLWPTDDEVASVWMRYFYMALRDSRSPAAALAVAQKRMSSTPQWSDPYYWAGYTLAGDWRPLP
jgi:CHAT domain-containing protein/predicted negative regulator of RcsB-dependent stress response